MALQLNVSYKGMDCSYWKIITSICDFSTNKTRVILGLYQNKAQRDAGVGNFLERQAVDVDGVDLSRENQYILIKASKPELVTPAKDAVLDADGNVTEPAVEAVYKETNPWALAENV